MEEGSEMKADNHEDWFLIKWIIVNDERYKPTTYHLVYPDDLVHPSRFRSGDGREQHCVKDAAAV